VLIGSKKPFVPRIPQIDGRSDVYSLGVMMFQLATGQLPFDDSSFGKLLIAHVQNQPPAPRSIAPSIPAPWEEIILRTLEKHPEARPQTMAELHESCTSAWRSWASAPTCRSIRGLQTEPGRRGFPRILAGAARRA
jgi:serine/threonine-protein kinase